MASQTTYIPRFLLPQYGPMWRTALRSAAFVRPLNVEVSHVMVRYASNVASRRPTALKIAATKVAAQRAASHKSSAAKAAKASAPTRPIPKTAAQAAAKTTAVPPTKTTAVPTAKTIAKPAAKTPATTFVRKATTPPTPTASKPVESAAAPPPVDPSKPIVLEKPERFNPPSHGARLPRSTPKHYGGPMSAGEIQAQRLKSYPGLPPPPNTWSHWFINKRGFHLFITLGTLTSLALYTFAANFQANSPYADLIPPIGEFPRHPFQYIGVCFDVFRMNELYESEQASEKRRRKVEDVTKRNEYRKAHGLGPEIGLFGSKASPYAPEEPLAEPAEAADAAPVESKEPEPSVAVEVTPDGKRKKFWGIF
ncbi:hypothetical protein GGS24DRAFT_443050 [Hypoxylon argillaceum]|nr:hypothetical protein GGS24DRAFT_443050 [Hypoxylon argillaceum]